jgi:hypothetical protein
MFNSYPIFPGWKRSGGGNNRLSLAKKLYQWELFPLNTMRLSWILTGSKFSEAAWSHF